MSDVELKDHMELNLTAYSQGLYFALFTLEDGTKISRKFIKQ